MKRRTFVAGVTVTGMSLASSAAGLGQEQASTVTPAGGGATDADGRSNRIHPDQRGADG
jgi:hypothetical protein